MNRHTIPLCFSKSLKFIGTGIAFCLLFTACTNSSPTPNSTQTVIPSPFPLSVTSSHSIVAPTSSPGPFDSASPTLSPFPTWTHTSQAQPTLHANPLLIAFTLLKDGKPSIYLIRPNGEGLAPLTAEQVSSYAPQWSLDGRRIAYLSGESRETTLLYIQDFETGQIHKVNFPGVTTFTWSPESRRLAFTTDPEAQGEQYYVYLISVDDWQLTPLYKIRKRARVYRLLWSPTEERILAMANVARDPTPYLLDISLTGEYKLLELEYWPYDVSWHPTGQKIGYSIDYLMDINGVVLAKPDGTQNQVILETDRSPFHLQWSPDGRMLAFVDDCHEQRCDVFVFNLETRITTQVSLSGAFSDYPGWSPDEENLTFLSASENPEINGYSLFLFSLESGKITKIMEKGLAPYTPVWRP